MKTCILINMNKISASYVKSSLRLFINILIVEFWNTDLRGFDVLNAAMISSLLFPVKLDFSVHRALKKEPCSGLHGLKIMSSRMSLTVNGSLLSQRYCVGFSIAIENCWLSLPAVPPKLSMNSLMPSSLLHHINQASSSPFRPLVIF